MNNDPVYEIARYDVSTDEEVLIERAQVLASDGELRIRVDDGPENLCAEIDLSAAIGADPVLSEVRANQVTRITATPGALHELPLMLRVPGQGEDFELSLWSTAMQKKYGFDYSPERGMYRVLHVNGERWGAWPTLNGEWMLPEDDVEPWQPHLTQRWAELTFMEGASMTSGGMGKKDDSAKLSAAR